MKAKRHHRLLGLSRRYLQHFKATAVEQQRTKNCLQSFERYLQSRVVQIGSVRVIKTEAFPNLSHLRQGIMLVNERLPRVPLRGSRRQGRRSFFRGNEARKIQNRQLLLLTLWSRHRHPNLRRRHKRKKMHQVAAEFSRHCSQPFREIVEVQQKMRSFWQSCVLFPIVQKAVSSLTCPARSEEKGVALPKMQSC